MIVLKHNYNGDQPSLHDWVTC